MVMNWKRWVCLAWLAVIPFSGNAATPMIAAGGNSSLFLNADGSVWGTGHLTQGGLDMVSPLRLLQLANVNAVAAGGSSNFALLSDGTVWGSGANSFGMLGDGTTQSRLDPQRVPGLSEVKAIAANSHVLALHEDGTVWAWGNNDAGQLGDGTRTDRYVPARVSGLADVIAISAGMQTSLALRADGTVWVWGFACCGSAGDGTNVQPNDPGYYHLVPTQVRNLDQVIAVAAGNGHHLALRADRTVWSWGRSDFGQNGTGTTSLNTELLPIQVPGLANVVAIAEDSRQSPVALKADGTVWGWGSNSLLQLGESGVTYAASPIRISGLADIVAISASETHRLALRQDGVVFAWGTNTFGPLGDNTLQDRAQPLPVVGPGGTGQLNLVQPAPASYNKLPTAQIGLSVSSGSAPLTVQAIATNAADPDGTVRAFYWKTSAGQQTTGASTTFTFAAAGRYEISLLVEDNSGGRSYAGQQVAVTPATSSAISVNPKVAISSELGIALANDGRILTWGEAGRLGLFDVFVTRTLPDANSHPVANGVIGVVDFSLGYNSAVTVSLSDGSVLGWGPNDHGQVGSGTQASDVMQPQVLSNLPRVQALASGFFHKLALTLDGRVFVWGGNNSGQLGLGDNENRFAPTELTGLTGIVAIAAGESFSAAVKADGTVWAWGDNSSYALGDGTTASRNRPIQIPGLSNITKAFTSAGALFAQTAVGTVWVTGRTPFGSSVYGDPGPEAGARRLSVLDGAVQISGAYTHILVLNADGTVLSGGFQQDLARGFPISGYIAGLKQLPGISDAIQVAAGKDNSVVLRRDGTVLAWGMNNYGQIGDGTLSMQQTPVLVVNQAVDGFLDLIPEVPNSIPQDKIPPFLLATYATGGLTATTLYADLKGTTGGAFASNDAGRFAAGYSVYVAANVPSITASPYFQLDSNNNWRVFTWPMAQFMSGVALDSQTNVVRAQILENADLSSPLFAGTSVLVGYGTDPDEMLRAGRYRTIFTVTQP